MFSIMFSKKSKYDQNITMKIKLLNNITYIEQMFIRENLILS